MSRAAKRSRLERLVRPVFGDGSERTRASGEVPTRGLVVDCATRIEHGSNRCELRWSQEHLGGRVGPLQGVVEPVLLVAGPEAEAVVLNFLPRHDLLPVGL